MSQVHVLFVCTGNTCRSPMAEGLFAQAAEGRGYEVSSAGVAAGNGSPASRETINILREKGIELGDFGSRMVDKSIMETASHVFCLTQGHLSMLKQHFPQHQEKFFLATEFAEIDGQVGKDVSDPFGGSRHEYDAVAVELEQAVAGILGFLEVEKD